MQSVDEVVFRMGGVASCDELRMRDFRLREIDRAVRSGALVRVRRGWVAGPDAPPEVLAAVRAGGTLTCVSVLRRHEIWAGVDDGRLHVRIPRLGTRPAEPDGVLRHRTLSLARLPPARGGVDSISEALAHAAMCQSRLDAVASIDSALFRKAISRRQVEHVLTRMPGCYARYLQVADARAESRIETRTRLGLRAVNIRCRPQVQLPGVGRVDLLVGDRLVVETDGHRWHSEEDDVRKDRARDLAATERGYLVLRLGYAQVMVEWPRVEAVVRGLVARGEHRWSARHRRGTLVAL
ncbi:MAG: DUF559 domain-containing protein [Herbiconiux sp.]|nr:DUF559 domain-containing protein [Herbiconiux sp.]